MYECQCHHVDDVEPLLGERHGRRFGRTVHSSCPGLSVCLSVRPFTHLWSVHPRVPCTTCLCLSVVRPSTCPLQHMRLSVCGPSIHVSLAPHVSVCLWLIHPRVPCSTCVCLSVVRPSTCPLHHILAKINRPWTKHCSGSASHETHQEWMGNRRTDRRVYKFTVVACGGSRRGKKPKRISGWWLVVVAAGEAQTK
jgi:hypothetical protein